MSDERMKPIIILPPDTMSAENVAMLRENGLCVVEASDPAKVRFMDPIPSAASRTNIEQAAISLSRKILSREWLSDDTKTYIVGRADIARMYVDLLVKGTPLDPTQPLQHEREQLIFDQAKADELRRLAREEAKAERAAAKAEKEAAKKKQPEQKK